MVSLGFRGVFALVLGLVLLGSSEAVDSWRMVYSTWFPDGAVRGELHGKLVLEDQQTLQIPDTYLTLALGAPPRVFGEGASGKWSFSGRLAFGARTTPITGAFGPSGVCTVVLPNLSIQDPGTPYLKGLKNVRTRRTLFLKMDRSVAGQPMVTASMTMKFGSKDTTLAPNPAVATGRLLPVTASYAFLPERVTFRFDGSESAGISGGVATGYLSAGRLLVAGVGAGYEAFSAGIPTTVFDKALRVEQGEGGKLFTRGVVPTSKGGVGMGIDVEFYQSGRIVGLYRKADWGTSAVARTVSIFSDDSLRSVLGYEYAMPSGGILKPFVTDNQSKARVAFDDLISEGGEVSAGGSGGVIRWQSSQLSVDSVGAAFVSDSKAWRFDPKTGFFSGAHIVAGGKAARKYSGVILQSGDSAASLIAEDGRSGSAEIFGDKPEFLPGGDLPEELTLLAGSSADLEVKLSGNNLVYRWYKLSDKGDWLEISTETTNRFRVVGADWSDRGEYRVVVFNSAYESLSEEERVAQGYQCESVCRVTVLAATARPVLAWVKDAAGVERYVVVDVEIEAARPPAFTVALTVPQGMPAIRVPLSVDETSGLLGTLTFSMDSGQVPGGTVNSMGVLTLAGALFRDASQQPFTLRVKASEDAMVYHPPATASGRVEVTVVQPPTGLVKRHLVRIGSGMNEILWDEALGGVGGGTTLVEIPSYNRAVPGSPRVNESGNLELDTDETSGPGGEGITPGRYPLAVILDWAGEKTAALLEIEYVNPLGDRVPEFMVRHNLTSKPTGAADAVMSWEIGAEVFLGGEPAVGGVSFDGAVWRFSLDTVPTGVTGTDLGATISPEGLVKVTKLPVDGVANEVDLFVLAETSELVKRQRRGVVRYTVVKPTEPAVDFTVYRGVLSPRISGLGGLSGVRSPVVVRDGGDLSGLMELRWDGTLGANVLALSAPDLPAVSRGLFEVWDAPAGIVCQKLNDRQLVVRNSGSAGPLVRLVGSELTGSGIPLRTKVESVNVGAGILSLSDSVEDGVGAVLVEPRVSYVAVDLKLVDPGARLEWTVPSDSGSLRLNLAQVLKDAISVGAGGNVVDGTSVLPGLRTSGLRFTKAAEGVGFTVSSDGVFNLSGESSSGDLICPVDVTMADESKSRVQILLRRSRADFSSSVALVPEGSATVGFLDRVSEKDGSLQLQGVSVRSVQARKVSGDSTTSWEALRNMGRVGEVVSSAFVSRSAVFGPVFYSATTGALSLAALEGDVVFLQESQPKVVRAVSDAEFSDGLLKPALPGALLSVSGPVQVGDTVSLVESAFPGWDGEYRVVGAGSASTVWSLVPTTSSTQGFYQVMRKGSTASEVGTTAWMMVRRQGALRISRELDASWATGMLVANSPSTLTADSGVLEVGTPVVLAGQINVAWDGVYSVADVGSSERPWVLVRHLSSDFSVAPSKVSVNFAVTPDDGTNLVVSGADAAGYREGEVLKVSGALGEGIYRFADANLYVFARVTGVSAASPSLTVDNSGVVSGVDRLKLPGGMSGLFGPSTNVFIASTTVMQSDSGDVPSVNVGDGFSVTFSGGDPANDGLYRVVGVVSRFVKETESLATTIEQSATLGGLISGNVYEVDRLPDGINPSVGDRIQLPGVRDSRFTGTRSEMQGGVYVVLRQSDGVDVTWLLAREPSLLEMSLSKVAGFSGLSYLNQGAVVTVSSNKVLVDGLTPTAGEWLFDPERGVYEVSQVNLVGADADSLVLAQVLETRVDQGGAVEVRRSSMGGVAAQIGIDLKCPVLGVVGGLGTVTGSKVIEVSSTSGLAVGMALSGDGIPVGARIVAVLDETRLDIGVAVSATGAGGTLGYGYDLMGRIQTDLLPSDVVNEEIQVTLLRGGQTLSVDLADYLGLFYGGEHRFTVLGGLPSFVRTDSLRTGSVAGAKIVDGSRTVISATADLRLGMCVFGDGIPLGARVSRIVDGNTFELDLPAFSTGSEVVVSYVSTLLEMRSVPTDWGTNEEVILYRLQSGANVSYGKVVLTIQDPAFSVGYVGITGGSPEVVQISEAKDFLKYKADHGLVEPVFFTLDSGAPSWLSVSSRGAVLFDCRALTEAVEQASVRVTFIDSRQDRTSESGAGEGYLVFEVKKPEALSDLVRLSAGEGSRLLALPGLTGSGIVVAPQVRLLSGDSGGGSIDGFGKLRLTPSGAFAPSFSGAGIRVSSASGVSDDESSGGSYVYAGEPYVLLEAYGSTRSDWSYQWMKNGVPISGARGAQLVLGLGVTEEQGVRVGGVTVHDEGMYSLVASNAYGRSESQGLYLRVVERSFIVNPTSLGLDENGVVVPIQTPTLSGARATLSVTAAGANRKQSDYVYHWYFTGSDGIERQILYEDEGGESDGWLLDRATGWQLVVEAFSMREEGAYRVEALLSEGDQVLDSEREFRERRWTLWSRPIITLQPRSVFSLSGEVVLFRIEVSPPIHPTLDTPDTVPSGYIGASQVRWWRLANGNIDEVGTGDTLSLGSHLVSKDAIDGAVFYAEVRDPNDPSYKLLSREVRLRVFNGPGLDESVSDDSIAGHVMKAVTIDGASSSYRVNVATTETTVGQWKTFMEDSSEAWMTSRQDSSANLRSSAWMKPGFAQDDTHPVVNVSWEEARNYCSWLSQRTGYRWRLMTAPEWLILTENRDYPWDGAWPPRALSGNLSRAVPTADDGYLFTSPAGLFNPFGEIFGLGGNVSEWLDEPYYEVRMPGGVRYDRGFRTFVGPSWATRDKSVARSDYRGRAAAGYRDNRIGFRVIAENLDYRVVPLGTLVMGDDVTPVAERLGFGPVVEFSGGAGSGAVGSADLSGGDLQGVTVQSGGTGYALGDTPVVTVRWRSLPEMPDHPAHRIKVPSVNVEETEVTFGKWNTVASWALANGYVFDSTPDAFGDTTDPSATEYKDNHPVHSVTWWDAVKWCNARSEMEGLTPCYYVADGSVYRGAGRPKIYDSNLKRTVDDEMRDEYVRWSANGYRLPTEAEWEKAAREGTQGWPFAFGNRATYPVQASQGGNSQTIFVADGGSFVVGALVFGTGVPSGTLVVSVAANVVTVSKPVNIGVSGSVGVYRFGRTSPDFETAAVSTLASSGYGLRGMLGSVREWCWDWYAGYDTSDAASYRGTKWDSASRSARYSLAPSTGVATVAGGAITSVTMDADIANLSTATVKVVVDGGHGHRNGDTVIFRTVLHPWLNGTYEGITVIDESTFVFSWKNNTGGTVSPIIDFTDGTVTKLMSQRVYRGGGWDSTTADDARVFARDHEPLTNVAMATTSSLAAVYTPGLAGGGIGDSLVSVNSRSLLIDGQSPEVGDRVLVKDQATPAENGIYIVTNTGSAISSYILTRDSAFDEGSELPSSNKQWVSVRAGALNAKSVWKVSVEATPTVGTSPITYAIQPGYFSTGLGFRVVKLQQ